MKFPGLKALWAWRMNHATSAEEPKVLIRKDPVSRFTESLVHLALLAITPYLLVLNFRNTYWLDTGAPHVNTKLEALQFAAKLYEILVCASLTSTGLYLLRRALWSPEGVPLGSLVASYGFGDVTILLSSAFWGGLAVAMQSRQQPRHLAVVIFLVLAIFIAAVAGPSAAILLIPQLDWWPQSYNATFSSQEVEIYFLNYSTTSLWPPTLNKSHLPNANCLAPTAVHNSVCPAGGYLDISAQIWGGSTSQNITMPGGEEFALEFLRYLIGESTYSAIASTQSEEISGSLWDAAGSSQPLWQNPRLTLTGLNGHNLLKPVVQVQCQTQDMAPSLPIQFQNAEFLTPPFPPLGSNPSEGYGTNVPNMYNGQNWTVNVSSIGNTAGLEGRMRNDSLYFAWVDLSQYDPRPSIAAAIFSPSCHSSAPGCITACSVDARWLPTDMWITPYQSQYVFDSYPNPLDLINSLAGEETLEPRPLYIGIDWAESLNLNLSGSSTSMESLLQSDSASVCVDNAYYVNNSYFQDILALALADGLARVGSGHSLSILLVNESSALLLVDGFDDDGYVLDGAQAMATVSNWTRLDIAFSRYGYGYGISTVTKRFAVAVLLGQAAIALATVATLALSKGISNSWSSVGELMVLAIKSKPTQRLENTGAGVSRLDTWKEKVMVGVANGERLQMFFEDDHYSKPDVGKKYA
jgi:hypothetical protein